MKTSHKSQIHKETVRDRGNGLHSHLPWGWLIFCFMCDGHQSAPGKTKCVHTSLARLGCYSGPSVNWNGPSAPQLGLLLSFAFPGHRQGPNGRKFQYNCAEQLMEEHWSLLKLEQNVLSLGLRGAPCILCQRLLDRKTANHSGQMCSTLSCRSCCCHTLQTHSPQAAIAVDIVPM